MSKKTYYWLVSLSILYFIFKTHLLLPESQFAYGFGVHAILGLFYTIPLYPLFFGMRLWAYNWIKSIKVSISLLMGFIGLVLILSFHGASHRYSTVFEGNWDAIPRYFEVLKYTFNWDKEIENFRLEWLVCLISWLFYFIRGCNSNKSEIKDNEFQDDIV